MVSKYKEDQAQNASEELKDMNRIMEEVNINMSLDKLCKLSQQVFG